MFSFLFGLPVVLIVLICVVVFVLHFLPAIIAGRRRVRNFWWIFAIDFLFGWTVVGWVIALVWALNDEPEWGPRYPAAPYR